MTHVERNDPYSKHNGCPQAEKYRFAAGCLMSSKSIIELGCGLGYGVKIL